MQFRTLGQVEGPTFRRILREREMVVQNDCYAAANGADAEYSEDYFRDLIELYGGMAAFIATPVWLDGRLEGVISLHQLGHAREWSDADVAAAAAAGESVRAVLERMTNSQS
jgi:GAF domain-containing protein